MTTNDNPTTAHARELARELREHDKNLHTSVPFHCIESADFLYDNAAHIAATLDALASENKRLHETLAELKAVASSFLEAADALRNLKRDPIAALAAPAQPQHHAPFRAATISDYLNGTISAGKLCELLGIER